MSTFAIDLLSGNPILLNKDIIDLSGATIQYADYLPLSGGTLTGNVEFTYTSNQLFIDIDNNVVGGIGITPQFSENNLTDEMVFVADDFAENGLNPLGVRVKGAYTTLSSKKLNLGVQGAQLGSRLVATSIDSNGEVEVGWETPQTPDYSTNISNSIDLLIGTGSAPTPWVALTQPLLIGRDVLATKGTFYFEILVENSSNKSGVFELSWGKNGSLPAIGIATYQIPAYFKSIITWTYTNGDLISGDTITPYGRIFASSNDQFILEAINSEKPTTLRFNVNLNGNTNLSQSGDTTTLTILSDTGTDVTLSGATSIKSGLMTATDKTNSDNLIGLSGSSYVKNVSNISGNTLTDALNNINNKISNIDNTSDLDKPVSTASRIIYDTLEGNGVVSGMTLSINVDTTKFNIATGVYHIIGGENIVYNGLSGITVPTIASANSTYIGLNVNGTIIQQLTRFTPTQRRSIIPLGLVIHSNRTNINVVNNLPEVAKNLHSQYYDLLCSLGAFNIEGNIISPNGDNMFINKSSGRLMKKGVNFENDVNNPHIKELIALVAPTTLRYRTSTGLESVDSQSIQPIYEVGGILQAVPNNRFIIQRIYLFSSNLLRIQPGTTLYTSKALAIQAITSEEFIPESNIAQNGLLRGYIILKGDTTSLLDTNKVTFIEADRWGEMPFGTTAGTTSLQQAYDNSITPEITTNPTLGALSIKNGNNDLTPCFEIYDSANTKTLSIDSKSNIVFGQYSGIGLKFDTTTPSYGWRDLVGQIVPRVGGGAAPALAALRGTRVLSYAFSVNDVIDNITYHIPHDYVPGSDLFLHVHWSHNGTAISGTLGISYFVQYAKGYNQAGQIFNSELTIPQSIVATGITTHPRWSHFINEFQLTNLGGDATHLDNSIIEVDALLMISLLVTSIPTITGGSPNAPYILMVDIHYQSTGLPTKGRNIPFYV